jgi:hypothetical protein
MTQQDNMHITSETTHEETSEETTTNTQPARIFKTGTTIIAEDDTLRSLGDDDVKALLQRTYPEIAHATVRETVQEDGTRLIEYIARAGRKG